ncbi:hypothetical protein ACJX0J_026916, partial [Zea mays]
TQKCFTNCNFPQGIQKKYFLPDNPLRSTGRVPIIHMIIFLDLPLYYVVLTIHILCLMDNILQAIFFRKPSYIVTQNGILIFHSLCFGQGILIAALRGDHFTKCKKDKKKGELVFFFPSCYIIVIIRVLICSGSDSDNRQAQYIRDRKVEPVHVVAVAPLVIEHLVLLTCLWMVNLQLTYSRET